MYAVVSKDCVQLLPGAVMTLPGSWQDYEMLRASRGDRSIPRIKYRQGEVLLMSPLPNHGRAAHFLARVAEVLLERSGHNYEAFTPITMELPGLGGIEPDYCFYVENWRAVMGKERFDWQVDPPPDLAIEVDVTSFTAAADYLPYRVPELWLFRNDILTIYRLVDGGYEVRSESCYLLGQPLGALVADCWSMVQTEGMGAAIAWLRQELG